MNSNDARPESGLSRRALLIGVGLFVLLALCALYANWKPWQQDQELERNLARVTARVRAEIEDQSARRELAKTAFPGLLTLTPEDGVIARAQVYSDGPDLRLEIGKVRLVLEDLRLKQSPSQLEVMILRPRGQEHEVQGGIFGEREELFSYTTLGRVLSGRFRGIPLRIEDAVLTIDGRSLELVSGTPTVVVLNKEGAIQELRALADPAAAEEPR